MTPQCFIVFTSECGVSDSDVVGNSEFVDDVDDFTNNDERVRQDSSSTPSGNNGPVDRDGTERGGVRDSSEALVGYSTDKVQGGSGEELDGDF